MKNQWLMINQLDRQLIEWGKVREKYGRLKLGWVKTIRRALGMTAEQLANRLGIHRSGLVRLERAEINGAVTLHTLEKVAKAMGCELVYAIVPVNASLSEKPLEGILQTEVERVASERIRRVSHTMSLEAQSVDEKSKNIQKQKLIKDLLNGPRKKIWIAK